MTWFLPQNGQISVDNFLTVNDVTLIIIIFKMRALFLLKMDKSVKMIQMDTFGVFFGRRKCFFFNLFISYYCYGNVNKIYLLLFNCIQKMIHFHFFWEKKEKRHQSIYALFLKHPKIKKLEKLKTKF